jgi:hypothetical protein
LCLEKSLDRLDRGNALVKRWFLKEARHLRSALDGAALFLSNRPELINLSPSPGRESDCRRSRLASADASLAKGRGLTHIPTIDPDGVGPAGMRDLE